MSPAILNPNRHTMPATPRTHPLHLLLAAALMLAANADAADKPASFGKGKATGPLLTRAQLRECLAQQGRIVALSEEAQKLQTGLAADKAGIAQLDAAHKDKLAALDRTSAEAVEAYNGEALLLDKMIDDYNGRTPAFNAKVDALKAERDSFAKGCDNRNYDESDEAAIRKGK